jgi:hypothetical protein
MWGEFVFERLGECDVDDLGAGSARDREWRFQLVTHYCYAWMGAEVTVVDLAANAF